MVIAAGRDGSAWSDGRAGWQHSSPARCDRVGDRVATRSARPLLEPERLTLSRPVDRKPSIGHQLVRGEFDGLPALKDGGDDIGRQEGQPEQPGQIGCGQPSPVRPTG